uniref:Uncharacterized protein n=1 Tax=Plectus sambesii TaxID=2011161 RepID=A0A914V379_9BILA
GASGPPLVATNQRGSPRPSSKGSAMDQHHMHSALPESDLDFAALLGLVDLSGAGKVSPTGQQHAFSPIEFQNGQPKAEGSRFSRFFAASQSGHGGAMDDAQRMPNRAPQQPSSAAVSAAAAAMLHQQQPALLQQLFGRPAPSAQQQQQSYQSHQSHQSHPQQPQPAAPSSRAFKGMTLEELEKSMLKSDDEALVASPPARYSGNRLSAAEAQVEEERR